jgi:hypothetical protein
MSPDCTKRYWSRRWELNPRPVDYESTALPLSYFGRSSRNAVFTIAFAESFRQLSRGMGLRRNAQQRPLPSLTREWVHHPPDAYAHKQKQEERPQNVLEAVIGTAASEKPKGNGNHRREKQKRLKVRHHERGSRRQALRPRAASYACSAASRFNTPAVARNRVP